MCASQFETKIISNIKVSKEYYLLNLESPLWFKDAQPGQFVHIRVGDFNDPLLRRPFSIHRINFVKQKSGQRRLNLQILYELKGKGTRLLSEKQVGEYLDIIGPLGRGFDYPLKDYKDQIHIIIAGGAGVAPLVFLAEKLTKSIRLRPLGLSGRSSKFHTKVGKIIALLGWSNSSKISCEKDFKDLGCEVNIATEDGGRGFKGKVTTLFEKKILPKLEISSQKVPVNKSINIYACGPASMLTTLAKICLINKIPLQVSLEEFMGCGIGACLGCAIETKEGFKRVCSDGPVFKAEDIVWEF